MLQVKQVSVAFNQHKIIQNISFSLPYGHKLAILGPNGSGKTTLLRAIDHLIDYQGSIKLGGKEVREMKRAEIAGQIGLLKQMSTSYFPYTVKELVMQGRYRRLKGQFFGTVDRTDKEFVEKCLVATGFQDKQDRRIDSLSGGQLQRAFLAKTLAQDPKIILLDEPTNHLDIYYQLELLDYLNDWMADGEHAVIGVFHDINLALSFSKEMLFLKAGQIVNQGQFNQIVSGQFLEHVFNTDVLGYLRRNEKLWQTIK